MLVKLLPLLMFDPETRSQWMSSTRGKGRRVRCDRVNRLSGRGAVGGEQELILSFFNKSNSLSCGSSSNRIHGIGSNSTLSLSGLAYRSVGFYPPGRIQRISQEWKSLSPSPSPATLSNTVTVIVIRQIVILLISPNSIDLSSTPLSPDWTIGVRPNKETFYFFQTHLAFSSF